MLRGDAVREAEEPGPHGPLQVVVGQVPMNLQEHVMREVLEVRGGDAETAEGVPDVRSVHGEEIPERRGLGLGLIRGQERGPTRWIGGTAPFSSSKVHDRIQTE